ncbi:hypothetical protein HII17_10560 [Thalassotalea sp. M1531]|uniref:Cardiolipin synthase N-terminal domain-containing protein n=1 Tax=Thalassotalea algicola TaxID=2716224 RepID=A0A7Y0LD62_9GAMM|nr:hypothetical protein [Thalassotalea algicola]
MNTTGIAELLTLVLFIITLAIVVRSKTSSNDKLIWFILSFAFPFVGFVVFYFFRVKSKD